MQVSLDTTKWYDRIWAAFIVFTRLPLGRLHQPSKEAYQTVMEHFPLVGWLTGTTMAAILYWGSRVLPYEIAILLAILARLLLTGAQHERGLANFTDGFGRGGSDRQRILNLMEGSHIGTYGTISLLVYFPLLFFALRAMPPLHAALTIAAADPFAKMLSAQLVQMMPYVHTQTRVSYRKFDMKAGISLAIQGLLPIGLYIYIMYATVDWQILIFAPAVTMYFLYMLIWRRLRGYTDDCCRAVFLLTELATLLVACYYLQ